MVQSRWRTLPFILLGLVAQSFASPNQPFENTAIVRTVELGGSIVHVTTTYAIKATQPNARTYTFALNTKDKDTVSWLEAKIKGQEESLSVREHPLDATKDYRLLDVTLPKALAINSTLNLVLESVQTHATFPWPKEARQTDEQALRYHTDLFVLSPYHTTVQRTKLRALAPRVISYTTPENVQAFTLSDPVTKAGATVTYGPYNNIPPSANDEFIFKNQQRVTVHYYHEQPVLEVRKLLRQAEISHWGANLNIQDDIILYNAGPTLKGQFSRKEHQSQVYFQRLSPHVLPAMSLLLPPGIRDAYYYDTIGNVSTSNLRVAPSAGKNSMANRPSVFEFKPRYPLLGGWNYSFTIGWDAPLADSAVYDKSSGRYIVEIPIMTPVNGAVVNDAEVQVILPEGATELEFSTPFPAVVNEFSTLKTYLDSIGRPQITFRYKNLTILHAQKLYVSYNVPFSAHLRKPLVVSVAFFSLFAVTIIGRRINLTLHKVKEL